MLGFASFAAFTFSDASVKLVAGGVPPYESAFFGAVFGLVALPFLRGTDRWGDIFVTVNRPLWWLRFASMGISTIGSVTAFTHLPMAEAFALIFLQPAYVTVMSVLFLHERVRLIRWGAVVLGFIGVLVVLRPGFRELSIGHLGAVLAGLGGSLSIVIFRAVGPREKRLSLYGAGVVGGITLCGLIMAAHFIWPSPRIWLCLAGYGLLAALANVLMMRAARHAPAAVLAPTQYSQMLWALLIGAVVFHDRIDTPTLIGIVLIIGSGLVTVLREKKRGTALPPPMEGAAATTRPDA